MKKIILILALLAVVSLLLLGCQFKEISKEASAEPVSTEEAEIDRSLSEVNELEDMSSDLDNVDADLDEVIIE